jgi:predicted glycosyltransferase
MKQKVLFAVLNWGLGHATRSETIINALISRGLDLSVASSGLALTYLKFKFPGLKFFDLPEKEVKYSQSGASMGLVKRALIQKNLNKKQYKWTAALLKDQAFDLIISDNVYGVYSAELPSILITHQLKPLSFILSRKVANEIASWINRFEEVWIPDLGENGIAGGMLQNSEVTIPKRFLGNISRFKFDKIEKDIDNLAIISGPEPQEGIFQDLVTQKLELHPGRNLVASAGKRPSDLGNVEYMALDENQNLNKLALRSHQIICRSGFTSLLDILKIGGNALIVPTPGQPEQEYLADRMKKLGLMRSVKQEAFSRCKLQATSSINMDKYWSISYLDKVLDETLRPKMPFEG